MKKKKSAMALKPPIDTIVAILKCRFDELINSKNDHAIYFAEPLGDVHGTQV
jgi:hypothetical protein